MSKRGHGEGTVYQRSDGTWCAQLRVGRKRHTFYGRTRREAQQKLRKLIGEVDRGLLPAEDRSTVEQYLNRWLEEVAKVTVRPRTWEGYRDLIKIHVVPEIGSLKLARLQPADLQALYADLLSEGLAPKTVRNAHGVIHKALSQAVKWGMVARNVADAVIPPKVARKEMRVLSPAQIKILLDAAKDTRWYTLLVLAISTGLRQGELLGLEWADIDLERGELQVSRQFGRDRRFSEPKSARGRRRIGIPGTAVVALQEHKQTQINDRTYAVG